MKDEILKRIIERDDNLRWSEKLSIRWDIIWSTFNSLPCPKIYLKPGQYISDVIDANGNPKEGIEIVY